MSDNTRYFVRSRHLAGRVAGKRVNIAFREMTAEEAEPHLRSQERRALQEAAELLAEQQRELDPESKRVLYSRMREMYAK